MSEPSEALALRAYALIAEVLARRIAELRPGPMADLAWALVEALNVEAQAAAGKRCPAGAGTPAQPHAELHHPATPATAAR